jgi:signal transduction histidine kinase
MIKQGEAKIESSEYSDLSRVIRWFILLRWIAAFGVLGTLIVARRLIARSFIREAFNFPLLYIILLVLLAVNGVFSVYFWVVKKQNFTRRELQVFFHIQIISDYSLLFLLVYFAGFLENPFIYYFVFHIMLTSFIFPSKTVFSYVTALVLVFGTFMLLRHDNEFREFYVFLLGTGKSSGVDRLVINGFAFLTTLVIAAYLVTRIKLRIVERGNKIEIELNKYKSLDKAKSNFILQVTHELRGPLAALKGYHEMILKGITGKIEEKTGETLHKADRRTKNLITIIDEMIDNAYLKSKDEINFTMVTVDVKELIQSNIDLVGVTAGQKNLTIVSLVSKNLKIKANKDLLNIIFSNILTNAVRYSLPGGKITIQAENSGGEIQFSIKDEGIGIEPDELENIFEEFYRTKKARLMERDGTGLGLSIIKKAVDSLTGRIVIYSEVDKGTTFHVYLPTKEE